MRKKINWSSGQQGLREICEYLGIKDIEREEVD